MVIHIGIIYRRRSDREAPSAPADPACREKGHTPDAVAVAKTSFDQATNDVATHLQALRSPSRRCPRPPRSASTGQPTPSAHTPKPFR